MNPRPKRGSWVPNHIETAIDKFKIKYNKLGEAALTQIAMSQDDATSIFSYDGNAEAVPDTFSLDQLTLVVSSHFQVDCTLVKLAEGGYHKVYDVLNADGVVLGVVRVPAPAFPKDKLESEVATLKYLATKTQVPVPRVYAWNSDASNPVGAEYMIMQKIPGASANILWDDLTNEARDRAVSQLSQYLDAIFALRFSKAGSLYLSSSEKGSFDVGPIISVPFYRAIDGSVRVPDWKSLREELEQYRGPFSSISDYLQTFLRAELHMLINHPSVIISEIRDVRASRGREEAKEVPVAVLDNTERIFRKALELFTVYPGNLRLAGQTSSPTESFSLLLDDFRLSNVMIDDSGNVTGLIDFERTTIAPIWECAILPPWIQNSDHPEGSYEGGPNQERERLREVFWKHMQSEEWRAMHEQGLFFRMWKWNVSYLSAVLIEGDPLEAYVDERMSWAREHPGVGHPEPVSDAEYDAIFEADLRERYS